MYLGKIEPILVRSPNLVATGGDSCSEGCEFKSRHSIQDGKFSTLIYFINCVDV